ncbi:hypothetical protein SKDZ_13G1780 [Saccharomyces kudriavzevii ZP591]|nr:hypothetical protein SKDZ_13G1780 [Saccharomyces kudriavzevii ZP591]
MDEDSDNLLLAFDGTNGVQSDPTIPNGLDSSVIDPTIADPTAIVTRKRRPQVKLTAEKLLSDKGLPYVLKNAHKRIRISSRKNSYANLSNIIQFYQLWAHELFPKAKFKDFMKICQTVGKTDPVLREYRVSLFRDEMDMSSDVGTREAEQSLKAQLPVAAEHVTGTSAEPIAAAPSNAQDKSNINDDDDDDDDDIYHFHVSNRRKRALRKEGDDASTIRNGIPPQEDTSALLRIFKEERPSDLDDNQKKLLSRWLDERRAMEKDSMTDEDVQLVQKLEEWEMINIQGAEAQYDFLPGEDDFGVDQDELDAMKEMGF